MKRVMIVVLTLFVIVGCDWFGNPNPFVGTWIGHGELTEQDTPSAGQTQVISIDDVMEFREDMTFSIRQGFRMTVDAVVTMSAFQVGTGSYSYDGTSMTMTFDATSDPGLSDDTPTYSFSEDGQTCTVQPTSLTFPLILERAG